MNGYETIWQLGASDAPLPPVVANAQANQDVKWYLESYRTYGPIFRVLRQDKPLTILAGPQANIFMTKVGTEALGHQVFWKGAAARNQDEVASPNQDGEANRQRRAGLFRSYSRGRILDRLPLLVETTRQFTSTWQPEQRILFFPWVQHLIAEQLGQLFTHYSLGEYFPDLMTYHHSARSPLQTPESLRAKQRVLELGRAIILTHRNGSLRDHEPDYVDDLLSAIGTAAQERIDEAWQMAAIAPIQAGIDTVGVTSSILLYTLLTHQEILERVMTEVDAVLLEKELSWESLKTMPSLHGTVMETLRVHPITTGHLCQALQPFTFAGYRVEQGEEVFVAITVSHFLPELFPNPQRFDIERYHDPRHEHRQPGAYAPFGVGDRSCVGAGVAEIQLIVIIASLLSLFHLTLDPALNNFHPDSFRVRVAARRHYASSIVRV
jgi:cytochrome P450